ncbi:hypothetical protein AND_008643 [Anopheles darlingi]|uniref:Uncharacterized protein n=1 Tax=Anopheles darlingi TaxID=43151 RepID=W5J5M1_ANODA|nr:hypothetical protein AND_008643 [Anopheles darlingi]
MYVIFPADELILLTYGIAVPRVQPRPTLDNLREPLVPTGSRPTSTTTTTITSSNTTTTTTSPSKHSKSTTSKTPSKPPATQQSSSSSPSNKKLNDSARQGPATSSTASPSTPHAPTAPHALERTANQRSLANQHSYESSGFDTFDDGNALVDSTELATFIDDGSSSSPRNGTLPATAFTTAGTGSTLGPAGGKGGKAATKQQQQEQQQQQGPGAKSPKSKLQLKLGRLRPHSTIDQPESASRVREDLHIHVSNPVFTRDNLRQRNFDAFFESGEQVYSLEVREKPRPFGDGTTGGSDPGLAGDLDPAGAAYGGFGQHQQQSLSALAQTQPRPSSLGFFRKPKSPISLRSKSAEHEFVEEPQKGDGQVPLP